MSRLLKCIEKSIEKYAQAATFVAAKSFEGDLKTRIHNQGLNSAGAKIGDYKEGAYKRKRAAREFEVGYVDLEFDGDLRKSLTTGTSKGQTVLGFDTDLSKVIYDAMTKKYGKIWRPTTLEHRDMEERFNTELMKQIKKCKGR